MLFFNRPVNPQKYFQVANLLLSSTEILSPVRRTHPAGKRHNIKSKSLTNEK